MSYVPLHVHTEYSILDGMCKVKELVARAKEIGCNSLAISDHGRCHGWLPFYTECKKQGIKPILGVEVYVVPDRLVKEAREGYHLILLAKNEEGYKNIIKIVSDAEEKGFYYKPKTDINVLREYGKGIIASSACMSGEIPRFLINGEYDRAKELALEYSKIFDEFYLELQATPTPDQLKLNSLIIELHEDTGIPLIVTTDTHYVMREDAIVHEVLLAVQTAAIFTEEDLKALNIFDGVYLVNDDKPKSKRKTATKKERTRFKLDSYNYWLKSKNEIMDMMPSYNGLLEVALENTQKIADKCELEIEFGKFKLPAYDIPDGHTADSLLAEKCYSALFDYFMENPHLDPNKYYDRLKYELDVMHEAGIAAYFLIDQDFIQWAKKNNIAVGPGRGSASASLVAFLLGIVELDPLGNKTNIEMIFERFYVKGRRDLPDIDTDYQDDRRSEVIEYVKNKYGSDKVARIVTFSKMGAKTALKDVGRSMGIPFNIMNAITKCIPDNIEDPDTGEKSLEVSIEDALNDINMDGELKKSALELREYQNKFPNLFRIAQKIEGLPRQTSIHAAGIVIAPVPISEFMPLMHCKSDDGILASQYDMKTLELIGAVKYDFLSLSTLTVINATLQSIKKHTGRDIDITNIPLDDRGVYKLLSSGETLGVFQVESFMFKELLKQMKPSTFSDIVAAVALGRPGPLDAGMDKVYIRNKHGFSRPDYPHEDLIPVLEKTHGIILYQEQLMEICKVLAGFDASEQDKVRKATGKKNLALIEEMGELFIKRAVARGYDQEMLESVWEKMKTFGRYGFNLAHSACYAMLTYRTAWLKVHYPIHFMAATMSFLTNSNAKDASDKLKDAISETRKMGFKLALPDINKSSYEFTVIDDKTINVGLRAIKGVGMKAIESIYETRPYFSFDDMLSKINRTICDKGVMDSLIMSGALDSFDENRIKLLEMYYGSRNENVPEFIKLDKDNMFAITDRYTMHDKLEWEKAHIGVYISRHPMEDIVSESWKDASLGSNIDAVGVLIKCNKIVTKKGDDMAFGTLDTSEGPLELVIFPNTFANVKDKLKINTIVRVKGKKEEESKCIINSLTNPRIPNLKDITI